MFMYDVLFESASKKITDFSPLIDTIKKAVKKYNEKAILSKRNMREILEVKASEEDERVLQIRLESEKILREGREGNSLQLLSEILVNEYGFYVYLDDRGKLFRSVA